MSSRTRIVLCHRGEWYAGRKAKHQLRVIHEAYVGPVIYPLRVSWKACLEWFKDAKTKVDALSLWVIREPRKTQDEKSMYKQVCAYYGLNEKIGGKKKRPVLGDFDFGAAPGGLPRAHNPFLRRAEEGRVPRTAAQAIRAARTAIAPMYAYADNRPPELVNMPLPTANRIEQGFNAAWNQMPQALDMNGLGVFGGYQAVAPTPPQPVVAPPWAEDDFFREEGPYYDEEADNGF